MIRRSYSSEPPDIIQRTSFHLRAGTATQHHANVDNVIGHGTSNQTCIHGTGCWPGAFAASYHTHAHFFFYFFPLPFWFYFIFSSNSVPRSVCVLLISSRASGDCSPLGGSEISARRNSRENCHFSCVEPGWEVVDTSRRCVRANSLFCLRSSKIVKPSSRKTFLSFHSRITCATFIVLHIVLLNCIYDSFWLIILVRHSGSFAVSPFQNLYGICQRNIVARCILMSFIKPNLSSRWFHSVQLIFPCILTFC